MIKHLQLLPLWLTLLAIASLLNIHIIYDNNWYAEKRIVQIIILSTLIISIFLSSNIRNNILAFLLNLSSLKKIAIAVFFSIGILSSSLSQLPFLGLLEVSNLFLLLLLAIFIANSRKRLDNIIDKIFISAFVACVIGYLVSFLSSLASGLIMGDSSIDYLNLIPGVLNRRFLNQFQSLSFPILLIAPLLLTDKKPIRIFLIFIAVFWFMMMIFTDGRGVIVATLTGIAVSGLLLKQERIFWWKYTLVVITLGIILYLLVNYLLSFYNITNIITGDTLRQTTGGRSIIWSETLSLIKDSPVLGIGPQHFYYEASSMGVAHPHNITLQLMLEWGIPATLIIMSLVAYTFWEWIKKQQKVTNNRHQNLLVIALTSAFIAGLTHGQFSGVFVMPLSQLTFVLISGWMLGIYLKGQKDRYTTKISTVASTVLITSSLIALTTVYYVSQPHLKYFINDVIPPSPYLDNHLVMKAQPPTNSAPRYWNQTIK